MSSKHVLHGEFPASLSYSETLLQETKQNKNQSSSWKKSHGIHEADRKEIAREGGGAGAGGL